MAIKLLDPAADQSLPEYHVGQASRTCIYPGIAQCFAIAGWKNGEMLCTHVSPGATKEDIDTTFEYLRDMGGDQAQRWYVVGPFTHHFAVVKAQWRSVKAIGKTFKELKNKNADRWILDVTTERNVFSWGIDVKAVPCDWAPVVYFDYKKTGRGNDWNELKVHKFVRF
jgi:hypothetical protein